MTKSKALMLAKYQSRYGMKWIVRKEHYMNNYFICPFNDVGYSGLGLIVQESL